MMAPRKTSSRGQPETAHSRTEEHADGCQWPEQSWAPEGACRGHHRGRRAGPAGRGGTWDRGSTPGRRATCPDRGTGRPQALAWPGGCQQGARPGGPPRTPRKHARSRDARAKRRDPRRAGRASARRRVPVQVGQRGPREPREGRRRRAARGAGQHAGRARASTHRHPTTPVPCGAGRPRCRAWVDTAGPPERRRRPSGGIAPHDPVERRGPRRGAGDPVCRTPGRAPARPARASPPWVLPGAARSARVARAGRGGPAPEWGTAVRGHAGPARGRAAVGSASGAGRAGQLRGRVAGPQPA